MSNAKINLSTQIDELDISPNIKNMLKKENIKSIKDLLVHAEKLKKQNSNDLSPNAKRIIKLANEISANRPELLGELTNVSTQKERSTVTLSTPILNLDFPDDVKSELNKVQIKTLGELIACSTHPQLKRRGIFYKNVRDKILIELAKLYELIPELKIMVAEKEKREEQNYKEICELSIDDLIWLPADVKSSLISIGVKTLGEFGTVTKKDFNNVCIAVDTLNMTIKIARKIQDYLENDEIQGEQVSSNKLLDPFTVKEFAPWWIKELQLVGIFNIRGIIECGGAYGLGKRGIKTAERMPDFCNCIWKVVEILSETSPDIQKEMEEKRRELEEKRKTYLKVPLDMITEVPEKVLRIIKAKQIKFIGELLELKIDSLSGLGLMGYEVQEVMNYISWLRTLCDNCDLCNVLLPEYNIDRAGLLDFLQRCDIKAPELTNIQIVNLTRKKGKSTHIEHNLLKKVNEAQALFREIALNGNNRDKD